MDTYLSDMVGYLNKIALKSIERGGERENRLVIGEKIKYSNCRRLDMRAAIEAGDNPLNNISRSHFGFDFYRFFKKDSEYKESYFILDIGCGSGSALNDMMNRSFSENLFCFGIDKEMAGHELPDGFFIKGDATNLKEIIKEKDRYIGIPCNCFDLVISTHVMHELIGNEAKDVFLNEIERVLKPKGHAIVTVPSRYDIQPLISNCIYMNNGEDKMHRSLVFRK